MKVEKQVTIQVGKESMTITESLEVEGAQGEGEVKELKIRDKNGKDYNITDIPDGTIITTETNPVCRWYFYRGRWWYVCDGGSEDQPG